ncbi:MAG: DUF2892 domain-containing protein [Denitrovibrio sp.]|nr:MAG: DUF2892 domain-containing protein [Denitrovibrio sp.]
MSIKDILRLVPGILILFSVAMGVYVNMWWLALAVFVGLNLIQSSLTKWCLLEDILRKMGIREQ